MRWAGAAVELAHWVIKLIAVRVYVVASKGHVGHTAPLIKL